MTRTPATALAIAPHADDEAIGCGGTLARLSDAGWRVQVVLMTRPAEGAARMAEARAAAAQLGTAYMLCLDCPEQGIPEEPALAARLHGALERLSPDLVFAPHAGEMDADHRAANRLVRAALRMRHLCDARPVPALWEYEIWTALARPDLIVDISAQAPRKRAAINAYRSQLRARDYTAAALGLNAYRAAMLGRGRGHAEAFLVPELPGQQGKERACIPWA